MSGSSIFVKYGIKSGGAAPFLRRTRNVFEQRQARTRTGSTSSQLQARTRSGSCPTAQRSYLNYSLYTNTTGKGGSNTNCGSIAAFNYVGNTNCNGTPFPGRCWIDRSLCQEEYGIWLSDQGTQECYVDYNSCVVETYSSGPCTHTGYGGWSNVSSCSAFTGSCTCGAITGRQCQTATLCNFSAFTAFSDVASCVVATPGCGQGAVQRECQTIYSFREQDWSAYEEAETCTTSSPNAAEGAVQVECIAN